MSTDSRRLSVLTAQEVDDLYGLPRFTEEDRRLYFALSPSERDLVDGVYTISVAVHLILQLGYFKAKRQFFVYAREAVTEDLEHILRRHFPTPEMADIKGLSKPTRLEQQQVILKLFGYQLCDTAAKSKLEQKAKRVAMLSTQPIFILRRGSAIPDESAHRRPWIHLFTGYGRPDSFRRTSTNYCSTGPSSYCGCGAPIGSPASG